MVDVLLGVGALLEAACGLVQEDGDEELHHGKCDEVSCRPPVEGLALLRGERADVVDVDVHGVSFEGRWVIIGHAFCATSEEKPLREFFGFCKD